MRLDFLDRTEELQRLRRFMERPGSGLAVVYGRRRCGKTRLIQQAASTGGAAYYMADDRDATLQRTALAMEIARVLPGFADVRYPEWSALLERLWREAGDRFCLIIDELPALVASAGELPSLLQKLLDRPDGRGPNIVLCGSSQHTMHGLALDKSAPLYGRAREILKIAPLPPGWILDAFDRLDATAAVEALAVWGGIPRYWELAREYDSLWPAVRDLVLSPLGVLHREPLALLQDDLREVAQSATVLALIGSGCHRSSEIAGRMQRPATALSRPLERLVDLGLVRRDTPFGTSARDTKRSLYRIDDPFVRFWFRFVEPARSRLEARQKDAVVVEIQGAWAGFVAATWEELVRASVPHMTFDGRTFGPAAAWWGPGRDRQPMELDVVAEAVDGSAVLVGEAKWEIASDVGRLTAELSRKAERLPLVEGRTVVPVLFLRSRPDQVPTGCIYLTPEDVLPVLR